MRALTLCCLVACLVACAPEDPDQVAGAVHPAPTAKRTILNDDELIAHAHALHQRILILDAHADIEIPGKPTRYAGADGVSRVSPDKLRAGGVDAVVVAAAVGPGPRDAAGYRQA